jgi:hypothetical protein
MAIWINAIENILRVTRIVKDGTAVDDGRMMEAKKCFRQLRSYCYLPCVREALADRANRQAKAAAVAVKPKAA